MGFYIGYDFIQYEYAPPILKEELFNEEGFLVEERNEEYDVYIIYSPIKGNLLWKASVYGLTDDKLKTYRYNNEEIKVEVSYRFDKKGNWVYKELLHYNDNVKYVTERIITYY